MKIINSLVIGISALALSSVILANTGHQNVKKHVLKPIARSVTNISKHTTVHIPVKKIAIAIAINKKASIKKIAIKKVSIQKVVIKKIGKVKLASSKAVPSKQLIHKLAVKLATHKNKLAMNTTNHKLNIILAKPANEKKLATKKLAAKTDMDLNAYAQSIAQTIERQTTAARLDFSMASKRHEVLTVAGSYT